MSWWNIEFAENTPWWESSFGTDEPIEHPWVRGDSRSYQILWAHIVNYIPIDQEREIVRIKIKPKTMSHPEGGYFDDFMLLRSMEDIKLWGAEFTHMPLEAVDPDTFSFPFEIPIFGAVADHDIEIVSVHLVPQQSISGNDTDYMKLTARNKGTGADICTKTYIESNDLTAYSVDNFSLPSPDHRFISAGNSMSIVVEKFGLGFVLPRSVIVIQWNPA